MKKGRNPKDLEGPFDSMKQFKSEFPEADSDIAFKTSYSRLRKFVKKLKKIYEVEAKVYKENIALTDDQKEMISTKRDNEMLFDEVLMFCNSYMEAYRKRAKETSVEVNQEEHKNLDEDKPAETQKETEIDVEAIKAEAFNEGYSKGRNVGYEQGSSEAYAKGKQDGYSLAQSEIPEPVEVDSTDFLKKAFKVSTLLTALPTLLMPMFVNDQSFRLTNYFTESELDLIKELFIPGKSYNTPNFDVSKLENPALILAFEKAINDVTLMAYVSQIFPMAGYMMNFGSPAFAPMMSGHPQMTINMPSQPQVQQPLSAQL